MGGETPIMPLFKREFQIKTKSPAPQARSVQETHPPVTADVEIGNPLGLVGADIMRPTH